MQVRVVSPVTPALGSVKTARSPLTMPAARDRCHQNIQVIEPALALEQSHLHALASESHPHCRALPVICAANQT